MIPKERLAVALHEIKELPDTEIEAILKRLNLSITRTFGGVTIAERTIIISEGDDFKAALDLSRVDLMVYNAKQNILSGQFVNGEHFEIAFEAPLPAETTNVLFQRWQSVHENI